MRNKTKVQPCTVQTKVTAVLAVNWCMNVNYSDKYVDLILTPFLSVTHSVYFSQSNLKFGNSAPFLWHRQQLDISFEIL